MLIAGSTVLAIDKTGAQLVVNIVAGNPECTVQQGSSNVILQFGVSYSKSFASMAKGQLMAAQYQGEDVKCCWVEKATIDKSSLTPCGSSTPTTGAPTRAPTTEAPSTTERYLTNVPTAPTYTTPTYTTPAPTPAPTTPAPTTTTPAPTTTTPEPYYSCPAGFTKDGKYCFYFSTAKKEWFDALKDCSAKKASLARPYTSAINSFIFNKIKKTGQSYWIDLNDRSWEGHWKYTNGLAPTFKFWESDEPNNGGWWSIHQEDCVAFDEDDDYKWNDRRCSNDHRYVCQKDATFHQG